MSAILDRTIPPSATGAASLSGGVSPRILYVEDDATIRNIYGEILLQAGYSVDLAVDGLIGWEALQRKKYELLITDHDMPRLTGLELAVRARRAGLALPIIIASASPCFAEGDDYYAWLRLSSLLPKPFTPRALLQTVEEVLCAVASAERWQSRPRMSESSGRAS